MKVFQSDIFEVKNNLLTKVGLIQIEANDFEDAKSKLNGMFLETEYIASSEVKVLVKLLTVEEAKELTNRAK